MKVLKGIAGLVSLCLVLPIWYYLFYKVLQAVNASELMWFLYWIYAPAAMFAALISKVAEDK